MLGRETRSRTSQTMRSSRLTTSQHPSTPPDNTGKSAHIDTLRNIGKGDTKNTSVQPLHILGIRWVIAKQPWVDGDTVVIAMGIFLLYFCQASDTGLVAYKKVGPAGQNSSSELSASSMAWSWLLLPGSPGCWEEEHIFQRRQIAHGKCAAKTPTSCCPVFLWCLRLFLRLRWSVLMPYRAPTISRAPEIPIPTGASIPDT